MFFSGLILGVWTNILVGFMMEPLLKGTHLQRSLCIIRKRRESIFVYGGLRSFGNFTKFLVIAIAVRIALPRHFWSIDDVTNDWPATKLVQRLWSKQKCWLLWKHTTAQIGATQTAWVRFKFRINKLCIFNLKMLGMCILRNFVQHQLKPYINMSRKPIISETHTPSP